MIKIYRFEVLLLLALTVVFCISLSVMRCAVTGSRIFLFLNWNLILAMVPWAFSTWLVNHKGRMNRYSIAAVSFAWLLFFPNSPYILTDLFHLNNNNGMPKWFDLILILSYAWTGLLFGFLSLFQIETMLLEKLSKVKTRMAVIALLFISCFGVYIGRFLRWNSWDIISNPLDLFTDIADQFIHPFEHVRTWGITILMGTLLSLIYFSLKMVVGMVKDKR